MRQKKKNLPKRLPFGDSSLVSDGRSCLLPPLSSETLTGSNLFRYCSFLHSLCELICISVLCLKDTVSLVFSISLYLITILLPLLQSSQNTKESDVINTSYLLLSIYGLSVYAHCPVVGLCIISNLLQAEVSITMTE